MATKRQQRMDTKYKSHLLCENCNRWTLVAMDDWRNATKRLREHGTPYIALCLRRSCINGRPEGLLDKARDSVIYGVKALEIKDGERDVFIYTDR